MKSFNIGDVTFTSTGLILVKQPPQEAWQEIGRRLKIMGESNNWHIGDWLNYGEKVYGKTYLDAAKKLNFAVKSLQNIASVARNVKSTLRKEELTWNHHAQVAKFVPDEQRKYLNMAVEKNLSVRELKNEIRKEHPVESLTKKPVKPIEDANAECQRLLGIFTTFSPTIVYNGKDSCFDITLKCRTAICVERVAKCLEVYESPAVDSDVSESEHASIVKAAENLQIVSPTILELAVQIGDEVTMSNDAVWTVVEVDPHYIACKTDTGGIYKVSSTSKIQIKHRKAYKTGVVQVEHPVQREDKGANPIPDMTFEDAAPLEPQPLPTSEKRDEIAAKEIAVLVLSGTKDKRLLWRSRNFLRIRVTQIICGKDALYRRYRFWHDISRRLWPCGWQGNQILRGGRRESYLFRRYEVTPGYPTEMPEDWTPTTETVDVSPEVQAIRSRQGAYLGNQKWVQKSRYVAEREQDPKVSAASQTIEPVQQEDDGANPISPLQPSVDKRRKLSAEQFNQIKEIYDQGKRTQSDIAKQFNISTATVSLIVNGKYKHVFTW